LDDDLATFHFTLIVVSDIVLAADWLLRFPTVALNARALTITRYCSPGACFGAASVWILRVVHIADGAGARCIARTLFLTGFPVDRDDVLEGVGSGEIARSSEEKGEERTGDKQPHHKNRCSREPTDRTALVSAR